MIQKIKTYMLVIASAFMMAVPMLVPAAVSAACTNIGTKVSTGAVAAGGTEGTNVTDYCAATATGGSDLAKIATNIVNIFSIIVGAVAVIMIIYGGFRYITSGGDSGRVGNAKSTLLYAVIGLIVVVLAQLIVHFVVAQSSTITQ